MQYIFAYAYQYYCTVHTNSLCNESREHTKKHICKLKKGTTHSLRGEVAGNGRKMYIQQEIAFKYANIPCLWMHCANEQRVFRLLIFALSSQ